MYKIGGWYKTRRGKRLTTRDRTPAMEGSSPTRIYFAPDKDRSWTMENYRDTKLRMAIRANKRSRAEYPQIHLAPGTLVLLRDKNMGIFNAENHTEYFTLERGEHLVEVVDSMGSILTMSLRDIRPVDIGW